MAGKRINDFFGVASNVIRTSIVIGQLFILSSANAQLMMGQGENAALYKEHCEACHGEDAKGGSAPSLVDDQWIYGQTEDAVITSITHGRPPRMGGYESVLSAGEIYSLNVYLKELKQKSAANPSVSEAQLDGMQFSSLKHDFTLTKVVDINDGYFYSVKFIDDKQILLPQRTGKLWVLTLPNSLEEIKGMPSVVYAYDGGLLDVVKHPDYASNGWIYLAYTPGVKLENNSPLPSVKAGFRIVRGRIKNNEWVDQELIFKTRQEHDDALATRFGTRLIFDKGLLFFSIGDGGNGLASQDLSMPNGKTYRIHDDGSIPVDNPFVDVENAYGAIWTYGNRNVQGISVQPNSGLMYASEHGPRGGDEVNLLQKGMNYGWPIITYGIDYNGKKVSDLTEKEGMQQPVTYWAPSISPGASTFYQGQQFSQWNNDLFVAGLQSQELHRLEIDGHKLIKDEIVLSGAGRIRDVAIGPDGNIYLSIETRMPETGAIYRMSPRRD